MKDLMLDLETMGNGSEAAIMSIGACYFDIKTGEIGNTFHKQINLESAVESGLVIDASTVLWWMKQSEEARSKFYDNDDAFGIHHVLAEFASFVEPHVKVWGNGATFDNVILKNAYKQCLNMDAPWAFYNDMDVRTMVRLGREVGFDPKKDMPFEGVKHDALADAIHQAKYVSAIYQKLITTSAS
ncbi:exodeoxyribonuclease VIII [Aliivibrio fischeri ES114]|uniref:Exodeoxyribonuclease VIII n=1 Tax=Aliivibrio fischeri (strain ATCC 700601 / ES114) TaxID=312309 RepID=Q5E371_ALIF1|nr:3'-5' exonuclease [Aliivibrio fischeri]AAW86525.1 exodeoxyribonuclease VIII [Aliivibrio fischeri ES114]KLU79192.1 ATPase [Aliivibrio fischeri]